MWQQSRVPEPRQSATAHLAPLITAYCCGRCAAQLAVPAPRSCRDVERVEDASGFAGFVVVERHPTGVLASANAGESGDGADQEPLENRTRPGVRCLHVSLAHLPGHVPPTGKNRRA